MPCSRGKDEDDPVKAIGIEPDYRRADEDGHHCEQPPQGAAQPSGGKPQRAVFWCRPWERVQARPPQRDTFTHDRVF